MHSVSVKRHRAKSRHFEKKMIILALIFANFASGQVLEANFTDYWPAEIDSVARMLQTYSECPQEQELKVYGRVPPWLVGSFYRNGPGEFFHITFLQLVILDFKTWR